MLGKEQYGLWTLAFSIIAYMGLADAFIVTCDSVNMLGEAAFTGKPVYAYRLPGGTPKFLQFQEALVSVTRNLARLRELGIGDFLDKPFTFGTVRINPSMDIFNLGNAPFPSPLFSFPHLFHAVHSPPYSMPLFFVNVVGCHGRNSLIIRS